MYMRVPTHVNSFPCYKTQTCVTQRQHAFDKCVTCMGFLSCGNVQVIPLPDESAIGIATALSRFVATATYGCIIELIYNKLLCN